MGLLPTVMWWTLFVVEVLALVLLCVAFWRRPSLVVNERPCVCDEINTRHCPEHGQ